jgi:hypothetical protein
LDANVYATKKTIAQGMLDVALLTANASQLKYLLQLGKEQQFFYLVCMTHVILRHRLLMIFSFTDDFAYKSVHHFAGKL